MAGLLGIAACTSLEDIDRRVDRVVAGQSETLGGGAIAPTARTRLRDGADTPQQYEKHPASLNPGADHLDYAGADPGRDVLARLDSYAEVPADAQRLDLQGVLRLSQQSAREYRTAEEDYLFAAIRLLIERHRWGPRLFDDLTSSFSADSLSGRYTNALNVINELRATQRLPYGGELEARLVTTAAQQLTEIVGNEYTQSSQLVLSANVPLLRGAGLVAQEDLIQSERDLVYAAREFETFRRRLFVDIASDYFALIAQQAAIRNQEERLKSLILFLEQTRALVEAGRERPFQARNVEQNVLTSRNSLVNSRESYILSLDQFKVRLGLPVRTPVALVPMSLDFQDPDIGVTEAAATALKYRLDFQNERDRVDDSRRQVAIARNSLLPDLNLNGSVTLNTDADNRVAGASFDGGQTDYAASVTFGLPLDREIERLQLRQSLIQLGQRMRQTDLFRDNVILDARRAVREVDRARFSVRLQEQAVKINELRLEEIQIKRAEIDAQTRLDAENELLQSRNDRDAAIRDLRIAILEYLVTTAQLRVGPEGEFRPLRGMEVKIEEAPDAMRPYPSPAEGENDAVPPEPVPESAPIDENPAVEPPVGAPGR